MPVRPGVIHYCGHMFESDPVAEAPLAERVRALLEERDVGAAFGSLASGGDILIAEAVLAHGGELHVVLPFAEADFIAQSVAPAGEAWLGRYRACSAAATSRTFASETQHSGDPGQYAHASRVAMGMARLRATQLGSDPVQIAIWDGIDSDGRAGTGADVATWRRLGGESIVVDAGTVDRRLGNLDPAQGG